jgi:hypothetical protein
MSTRIHVYISWVDMALLTEGETRFSWQLENGPPNGGPRAQTEEPLWDSHV